MKNKIRRFKDYKDPYVVIIGDNEAENDLISINIRGNKQLKNSPLELNGWRVYCRYSNQVGYRDTETALLTVLESAEAVQEAQAAAQAATEG